jgi:hypothetical protein
MAPRDGLFALRAHPSGRPVGDHRRYAALSNRACLCRRFELIRVAGVADDRMENFFECGSPGRIRTADQRINSPSLYH